MRKINRSHALACLMLVLLSSAVTPALAGNLFSWLEPSSSSDIVALAQDYEGLGERKDRSVLKATLGVDPVSTPWCAAFINTLLEKQGRRGSGELTAASFLRWGKKTIRPQPGDIVVMRNHVTIFLGFSDDGKYVSTIGGNQNNMVQIQEYPLKRVLSFRTYSETDEPEFLPTPKKKVAVNVSKKKKKSKKKSRII